ncbi:hypothetical protein M231_01063 [Tremella mesenterica]|uniref:Uncharacterized protein n=1 Tax=Tremella mesenterica TaxID=5217 RepID=A0A4Q1BTZ6_TREME|nr:hypothetical protein M231_01063 [Tremella mesenterica]
MSTNQNHLEVGDNFNKKSTISSRFVLPNRSNWLEWLPFFKRKTGTLPSLTWQVRPNLLSLLKANRLYPKRPTEKTKLFPTSRHKHYGIHKGLQTVHTCMSPSPLSSPSPSSSPYMKTSTSTPKLERYKQKSTTIPFPSTILPNQQQHHTSFTESYRVINPNISPMRHHPTRDENAQYNITRTRTGKDHIPQRMTYDSKGHVSEKPRKHVVRFSEKYE